jgi:alcohol dehydrogenase (cytochrome c)
MVAAAGANATRQRPEPREVKMRKRTGHAVVLIGAAAVGLIVALPLAAEEMTQQRLLNADNEQANWIHHHKNYAGHRFSLLKQINRDTVKNLKVAWTMQLGGIEGGGIWPHGG